MTTGRKKKGTGKSRLYGFLFVVAIAIAVSCLTKKEGEQTQLQQPQQSAAAGHNVEFSIDLAIPQFTKATESQVVEHRGYTVSYNKKRKNPNWVAYELTAEEAEGTEPRNGEFIPDPLVKGAQGDTRDYINSGWTRGHHAPAGDMKWSEESMTESFYLSNISPQNGNLNNGVWKYIENIARDNALKYGKILIVTGPVFTTEKGLGSIGRNRILIPDGFYKVLLIDDDGYKGIGFYCDNVAGKNKLSSYAMSIDSIEKMTGIDFFHNLPDEVEDVVESEYNWNVWR